MKTTIKALMVTVLSLISSNAHAFQDDLYFICHAGVSGSNVACEGDFRNPAAKDACLGTLSRIPAYCKAIDSQRDANLFHICLAGASRSAYHCASIRNSSKALMACVGIVTGTPQACASVGEMQD